jgi:predicted alpha/beta-fold hydrolase
MHYRAELRMVALADGDQIALHDDCPDEWKPGEQVVMLVHGMGGCHSSGYVQRLTAKLSARGARVFRMDMRGVGAAARAGAAPAHAGRSGDVSTALVEIARLCPRSPIMLVGFSLGANISLMLAAETERHPVPRLDGIIAVSPPADLYECCRLLQRGLGHAYDRYLARGLVRQWQANHGPINGRRPRSIIEFDQLVTAPNSGFRHVLEYYERCSCGPHLVKIQIPTRIIAARDDPVVPFETIAKFPRSAAVKLYATRSGGHLGFLSVRSQAADRRWMDGQIERWICDQ